MPKKIDSKKIRREFPMLAADRGLIYLDSAASSQTPLAVLAAMDGYYRHYRANVHRGLYPASETATATYEAARAKVAELLNATPSEIIFTRGATEGLNLVAYSLAPTLKRGDSVVLTAMEHHSNLVPWQQLAKKYGFAVKFIGLTADGQLDLKSAAKLIQSGRVKVVSLIHVSNALGTVVPVRDLTRMAHRRGAAVIIDAAQSAGHRPLDVRDIDCDFLAFSGHKMFGPTGIGVLYGRKERLESLPPFFFGGDMIAQVSYEDASWNDLPWKFEAGTPNIAGAIGLGAAVDFIRKLGLDNIQRHESEIVAYAVRRLAGVEQAVVYGPPLGHDRGGLVSFGIEGIHPHDLTGILAGRGLCVRGGHHCAMPLMRRLKIPGTTRASFSVFNTKDDIDALVSAVEGAKRTFKI